jgi:hypothetical protein
MGFYAKQSNYANCTYYTDSGVVQYRPCLAGAVSCERCPLDRPNTYTDGSTSVDNCTQCGNEQYIAANGECAACTAQCMDYEYESVQRTPSTNRKCNICYRTECGLEGNLGQSMTPFAQSL